MDNETIRRSNMVTMLNPRGALRSVSSSMLAELKAQGWREITNPKRDYFPEFDGGNQNKNIPTVNVEDDLDSINVLRFEEL